MRDAAAPPVVVQWGAISEARRFCRRFWGRMRQPTGHPPPAGHWPPAAAPQNAAESDLVKDGKAAEIAEQVISILEEGKQGTTADWTWSWLARALVAKAPGADEELVCDVVQKLAGTFLIQPMPKPTPKTKKKLEINSAEEAVLRTALNKGAVQPPAPPAPPPPPLPLPSPVAAPLQPPAT